MTDEYVVVEIGCGERPLPPADQAALVVGVDIDATALRRAARSGGSEAHIAADARALPLAAGSCHEVRLRAVLHHLVPTERALAELARVMAVGGSLTIVDGVRLAPGEARRLEAELVDAGLPLEPILGFDPHRLAAEVTAAGFVVDAIALDGVATWATPPYVSRTYTSERFVVTARRV